MLYNALFARYPKSVPSRGVSTPHLIHVPRTRLTQHSELHLDRFSRFCTAAHGRQSLYFTMRVKTRLTCDRKIAAINAIKYKSFASPKKYQTRVNDNS